MDRPAPPHRVEVELGGKGVEFGELAVEDALQSHRRPKLERYGDTLFVALRATRHLDAQEEVDFGELHIYELSRETVEFQRATRPLVGMLHGLRAGFTKYGTNEELQRYLRDVADHVTHTSERVDGFRQALTETLTVNATLASPQQNAEMRALA